MKITIEVDGGQAQISGLGQAVPQAGAPTPVPSQAPSDLLARAAATGAIDAGPAPSIPLAPGAPTQAQPPGPTAPGVAAGITDSAAGAAPGAAPDVTVEKPVADDDTEEEGD